MKILEHILKTSEEDFDATEVQESDEVVDVILKAGGDASELLQPSEQALDFPAALVTTKGSAILRRF